MMNDRDRYQREEIIFLFKTFYAFFLRGAYTADHNPLFFKENLFISPVTGLNSTSLANHPPGSKYPYTFFPFKIAFNENLFSILVFATK